ncbi:N-acetylmuramoyl-L-alanine amidase [Paenibacillus sp. HN-1]|uniref:N-acetylmuramoyl-L-alanine amidase n=1 Tax=Paenibacillus TaxID=44249 RepID=UPI001CA8B3AF|nr:MULTISPECIES: N-acetylmuramoyl-L-alanine amidase [Paenibacillus]MBY9079148.1 N-acetylmuramoyl-L-alanine amidase [Paenibacillus sp. CGMCC 1.18879]MBY9086926.1 N-acetylmuramoyl-L-alanine amidase [Paenibacillus sinensis]
MNREITSRTSPDQRTSKRPRTYSRSRRKAWLKPAAWLTAVLAAALCLVPASSYTVRADSYTAKVYASSLNVRSEPAAGSAITGSLQSGAVVTVTDEQHGWLKIRKGSLTGWVAGYYLKRSSGSPSAVQSSPSPAASSSSAGGSSSRSRATVTADSLRIRSGPGTGYEVVGSLRTGNSVTVLSSRSGWTNIRTAEGVTGWVSSSYISSTAASNSSSSSSSASGGSATRSHSGGIQGKLIVVDAGHGGDDPGMIGTTYGTMEKDLNLQTALYLRDYLTAAGAKVRMTRTLDSQKPSLSRRAQLSQTIGADAFVSVHFNSSPKKVSGTLTFFYSESGDLPLARAIEHRLGDGIGLKSNGLSFGNYHILRENTIPAALVELGFLTSARDESIVRTSSYQKKAARAIADGLADYFAK